MSTILTLNDLMSKDILVILQTLECKESITKDFLRLSLQNVRLFDSKQSDYGPGNIAKFGEFGCIVRMSDKFERLRNLSFKGNNQVEVPKNESIEDTYRDIANYAIIALMCRHGVWPKGD